jgi:hypothetical protein
VISGCLCNCGSPQTSHAWQKNPIAALKKHFGFYTSGFCKVRTLIVVQNPFSQRKNSFNEGDTRLLPTPRNNGEIDQKIDGLVTSNHMFWPNERKKRAFLLPSRLPNPSFLASKGNGRGQEGAGGSVGCSCRKCRIDMLTRNFCPKKRSQPDSYCSQKKCRATSAHSHRMDGKIDFRPHFGLSASSQPCL